MREVYCAKSVPDDGRSMSFHQCLRRGINEEDGKLWCKQHTPSIVAAKDYERRQKWKKEGVISDARWDIRMAEFSLVNAVREHGLDEAALDKEYQALLGSRREASGSGKGFQMSEPTEPTEEQLDRVIEICSKEALKPWEERFLSGGDLEAIRALLDHQQALLDENARLRKALEFYGYEENHYVDADPIAPASPVHKDYGRRARAALDNQRADSGGD